MPLASLSVVIICSRTPRRGKSGVFKAEHLGAVVEGRYTWNYNARGSQSHNACHWAFGGRSWNLLERTIQEFMLVLGTGCIYVHKSTEGMHACMYTRRTNRPRSLLPIPTIHSLLPCQKSVGGTIYILGALSLSLSLSLSQDE